MPGVFWVEFFLVMGEPIEFLALVLGREILDPCIAAVWQCGPPCFEISFRWGSSSEHLDLLHPGYGESQLTQHTIDPNSPHKLLWEADAKNQSVEHME